MAKGSSQLWLQRQNNDCFVKEAKQKGLRSRAAFKLIELQDKYHFIAHNANVIDLGAAPGSWSQQVIKWTSKKVIAVDILAIDPIDNVDIIQGDFCALATFDKVLILANNNIDVVMSDMAPNLSGDWGIDMPRVLYLGELVLELAKTVLVRGGSMLVKSFQGSGFEQYLKEVRQSFKRVVICEPKSSRAKSREVYLLATQYNGLRG